MPVHRGGNAERAGLGNRFAQEVNQRVVDTPVFDASGREQKFHYSSLYEGNITAALIFDRSDNHSSNGQGSRPQWSNRSVHVYDNARGRSPRADERELAGCGVLRKDSFALAQQDRIDEQQNFIGQPMLDQHGRQGRTSPDDQVRAVLRLNAANALHNVLAEILDRPPFETVRPVGRDILRRGVQTIRHRIVCDLWPVVTPYIVGMATKQQIEGAAMSSTDSFSYGRIGMWRGPTTIFVVSIFTPSARRLDDTVNGNVFDDPDVLISSLLPSDISPQ